MEDSGEQITDEVYSRTCPNWDTLPVLLALILVHLEWIPIIIYWNDPESVTLNQYRLIICSWCGLKLQSITHESIYKISSTEFDVEIYVKTKKKPILIKCKRLSVEPQDLSAAIQSRIDAAKEKKE